MKYGIFFLLGLFCGAFILSEGFTAGTLVKTPHGYTVIEDLSVGDLVVCFDDNNNCVERLVTHVARENVLEYAAVFTENECICLSVDQQMYVEELQEWSKPADLKIGDFLLTSCFGLHSIKSIAEIKEPACVYLLSVEEYHNFFVSQGDFCAHNFFPAIFLGVSVLFGSGIEIAGFSCGLAGLGTCLGYQWYQKNKQHTVKIGPSGFGQEKELGDAQAPGKPTEDDGYIPPKKWDGKKIKDPNGGGFGWPDRRGNIWIPTGPKAHRGPHWDVQDPKTGRHRNVLPGGRIC